MCARTMGLETLPSEILLEIAQYLAFFDQRALAESSTKIGPLLPLPENPHELEYQVHLSQSALRPVNTKHPLVKRSLGVSKLLHSITSRLIWDYLWHSSDSENCRWSTVNIGVNAEPSDSPDSKSLENFLFPYWGIEFPRSCLVYFYVSRIRDFAERACQDLSCEYWAACGALGRSHEHVKALQRLHHTWRSHFDCARLSVKWFERRLPCNDYLWKGPLVHEPTHPNV